MDLWIIILTIIGGAMSIYLYLTRHFNYFKRLGISYVKPTPIFGNMTKAIFKVTTIFDTLVEVYDCDPEAKYVGYWQFTTPMIMLRDPELVKSITIQNFDSFPNHKVVVDTSLEPLLEKSLFALNDNVWKDMRSLLSPSFTSSKMKMMFEIISKCAVDFADDLSEEEQQPEGLDMKDTFGRYTLDVIAATACGLTVNSMKDRDNEFYRMASTAVDISGFRILKFFFIVGFPRLAKLLNMRFINPESSEFFVNVIKKTVATRDAEGIVRPDMLQLMMQARDRKEKSALSIEDIAAQAFTFVFAGSDQPSTTMGFAARLLALNPDVQRKLQTEIDQVIETSPGGVSYEDLHAMKYLDAVVSETLRLFPPNPFLDRIALKSFTLPPALPGLKPVRIDAGQVIGIPSYCFHRDPRYFSDPEKFDPERFCDEDNKSAINPLTYFPFGIGPRICIANRFALMKMKLALFHVLAKCSFSPTPNTPPVIKLSKKSFKMIPEGGFQLVVEPRT